MDRRSAALQFVHEAPIFLFSKYFSLILKAVTSLIDWVPSARLLLSPQEQVARPACFQKGILCRPFTRPHPTTDPQLGLFRNQTRTPPQRPKPRPQPTLFFPSTG